jgi:hypothetical protein
VVPSRNPSNKLDISRSSGSNQLGKNASIIAKLPCLWQGERNYPECNNFGRSQNCSSYECVQQVRYEPIERIELVGNEREHRRETAVFMAGNKTTPCATTLDVVEMAPHASPSNKLGINLIERIKFVGKNVIIVASNHQRSRRKSIHIKHEHSRSLFKTYNTKSTRQERGRSLRHNLWQKVDL